MFSIFKNYYVLRHNLVSLFSIHVILRNKMKMNKQIKVRKNCLLLEKHSYLWVNSKKHYTQWCTYKYVTWQAFNFHFLFFLKFWLNKTKQKRELWSVNWITGLSRLAFVFDFQIRRRVYYLTFVLKSRPKGGPCYSWTLRSILSYIFSHVRNFIFK